MNSLSSDASCMSRQFANVEDMGELNRTSRISINNPPVEMSLEISRQTRDESVVPRGPTSSETDINDANVPLIDDIIGNPYE